MKIILYPILFVLLMAQISSESLGMRRDGDDELKQNEVKRRRVDAAPATAQADVALAPIVRQSIKVPLSVARASLVKACAYVIGKEVVEHGTEIFAGWDAGSLAILDDDPRCGRILTSQIRQQAQARWRQHNFWGDVTQTLGGNADRIVLVEFSPDGKFLASGSEDGSIKIYRLNQYGTWGITQTFDSTNGGHTAAVWSMQFSPDGKFLASGSSDRSVKIYSLNQDETWGITQTFDSTNGGHTAAVWVMEFSPDGKFLASGASDGSIKIYSLNQNGTWNITQAFDRTNEGHNDWVLLEEFSPDSKFFATGSEDGSVKIYRLNQYGTWGITQTFDSTNGGHITSVWAMEFSPDGRTLVSESEDCSVKIYSLNQDGTWSISQTFARTEEWHLGHLGHLDGDRSMKFSPDGKFLASKSYPGLVKIYTLWTRRRLLDEIQTLRQPDPAASLGWFSWLNPFGR